LLEPKKKTGSVENPVTKLFPAAVTERQFLDEMDRLREIRPTIDYRDEPFSGHTLVDFTILENGLELPVNVKNAGTRFEFTIRPPPCFIMTLAHASDNPYELPLPEASEEVETNRRVAACNQKING
jgi:hypothetical protein